jgi:hypothetical protein
MLDAFAALRLVQIVSSKAICRRLGYILTDFARCELPGTAFKNPCLGIRLRK